MSEPQTNGAPPFDRRWGLERRSGLERRFNERRMALDRVVEVEARTGRDRRRRQRREQDRRNRAHRKSRRGFASMTPEKRRALARKGGLAAQAKGTGHRWTVDEARAAALGRGNAKTQGSPGAAGTGGPRHPVETLLTHVTELTDALKRAQNEQ